MLPANSKTVFVIMGLEKHIPRMDNCISTIKLVYGDEMDFDIAIGTFTGPKLQEPTGSELENFAKKNNYLFHNSGNQSFIETNIPEVFHNMANVLNEDCPQGPEGISPEDISKIKENLQFDLANTGVLKWSKEASWNLIENPTHEILGNLSLSRYFYDLGYDEVYLMHNDMYFIDDFLPSFRKRQINNWAFIAPALSPVLEKHKWNNKTIREFCLKAQSPYLHPRYEIRIAQALMIYNKELVKKVYDTYNTDEELYRQYLQPFHRCGDIATIQLFDDFLGFRGNIIPPSDEIMYDPAWSDISQSDSDKLTTSLIRNSTCFIHGPFLKGPLPEGITELIQLIKKLKKRN